MTPFEAFNIARNWRPCMNGIFDHFRVGDGRPIDERHRQVCIKMIFELLACGPSRADAIELSRLGAFVVETKLYCASAAPDYGGSAPRSDARGPDLHL
jgi:hypothetical protein